MLWYAPWFLCSIVTLDFKALTINDKACCPQNVTNSCQGFDCGHSFPAFILIHCIPGLPYSLCQFTLRDAYTFSLYVQLPAKLLHPSWGGFHGAQILTRSNCCVNISLHHYVNKKSKQFSVLLENSIRKYQNRAIQAAQLIEELIGLAKQMREEAAKGEELGLSEDEVAFYDALEVNDSAVKVLGEPTLKSIARELVDTVRRNTTIDWTVRENIRANLRVLVKRILRKYGYPPDKQEKATLTVLEQAEALSTNWATT